MNACSRLELHASLSHQSHVSRATCFIAAKRRVTRIVFTLHRLECFWCEDLRCSPQIQVRHHLLEMMKKKQRINWTSISNAGLIDIDKSLGCCLKWHADSAVLGNNDSLMIIRMWWEPRLETFHLRPCIYSIKPNEESDTKWKYESETWFILSYSSNWLQLIDLKQPMLIPYRSLVSKRLHCQWCGCAT